VRRAKIAAMHTLRSDAAAALAIVLWAQVAAAEPDAIDGGAGVQKSGDVLQWAIPLAGLGLTFLLNPQRGQAPLKLTGTEDVSASGPATPGLNWPGPRLASSPQQDFAVALARTEVVTLGLKYAVNAPRPNGSGRSFPSGHTSAAFMGAEFIRKQYGPWWGAPAYLTAGWVGYTRVESGHHYWRDVAAGALVGITSNHDFDQINTPLGKLRFGPALLSVPRNEWRAPNALDADSSFLAQQNTLVPGLRFELRF
jgi:hypothetical protein